jgi:hypothetical protein
MRSDFWAMNIKPSWFLSGVNYREKILILYNSSRCFYHVPSWHSRLSINAVWEARMLAKSHSTRLFQLFRNFKKKKKNNFYSQQNDMSPTESAQQQLDTFFPDSLLSANVPCALLSSLFKIWWKTLYEEEKNKFRFILKYCPRQKF